MSTRGPLRTRRRSRARRWIAVGILAAAIVLETAGPAAAAPSNVSIDVSPGAKARVDTALTFTGSATPEAGTTIASYSWDFGEGAPTGGNPATHAFATPGARTVTLTVTDSNGATATAQTGVDIHTLPTAGFTWSPVIPNIGQLVTFDASGSTDTAGSIASYAWDFGDGATDTGQQPTHAYTSSGDKLVKLTITAVFDGRTATLPKTLHVNVPPVAGITFSAVFDFRTGQDPFTPLIGQNVVFTGMWTPTAQPDFRGSFDPDGSRLDPNAKPANGSIDTYEWDLGDGAFVPSTVSRYPVVFPSAGPKTVRLRVTDEHGATAIAAKTFRVNTLPVAGFTFAPGSPNPKEVVTFTSTATDPDGPSDLATIGWELNGDNKYNDASGPSAQAIYTVPGDYTVGQRVTDQGKAPAATFRTVSVSGPPAAKQDLPPGATVVGAGSPAAGGASGSGSGASASKAPAGLKLMRGARVQVGGSINGRVTTFTQFLIVAPKGARVTVTCRGKGCPKRTIRRRMGASRRLRLRLLQRALGAGARITVMISRPGYVTKRTQFTLRRWRPPTRRESCVAPDSGKTVRCPS